MFGQEGSKLAASVGSTTAPQREPIMHTAMSQQSLALMDLESVVSRLYERLQHVVRQEPSNASKPAGEGNPSVPILVNAIFENNTRIKSAAMALEQLIDKLEI